MLTKKVNGLLLFGHGAKHGILIDKKMHYYCETKPNNIEYAVQFHCNNQGGSSIEKYIPGKEDYQNNEVRRRGDINPILKDRKFLEKLKSLNPVA